MSKYTIILILINTAIFALGLSLAKQSRGAEIQHSSFAVSKIHNKRDFNARRFDTLAGVGQNKEYWTHQLNLAIDTKIVDFSEYASPLVSAGLIYWNQEIEAQSTNKQYRRVHWDYELGYKLPWTIKGYYNISVFWKHRSEHLLDVDAKDYPLADVYGAKLCLLGCKIKEN